MLMVSDISPYMYIGYNCYVTPTRFNNLPNNCEQISMSVWPTLMAVASPVPTLSAPSPVLVPMDILSLAMAALAMVRITYTV